MIIKHKLSVSDDETVEQIRENPYLQYFIGLKGFQSKAPFAPSLFVEMRKRMGQMVFDEFHEAIIDAIEPGKVGQIVKLKKTMIIMAIRFPTDLGLLNEARELSERIIDELHTNSSRPPKVTSENEDEVKRFKVQRRQEYRQRTPIEGKFGYRLNNIRARRADTSGTGIPASASFRIATIWCSVNRLLLVKTPI